MTESDIQAWVDVESPPTDQSNGDWPYHFPGAPDPQSVRIPVAGPEPFNTLVLVQGYGYWGIGEISNDELYRLRYGIKTSFDLRGYDNLVDLDPIPYKHSTIAAQLMLQADDDTPFVVAIDAVDGFFDKNGTWVVALDIASQWKGVHSSSTCYYSSWVLCKEPPLPPGLP
jgi:hypothetical protein